MSAKVGRCLELGGELFSWLVICVFVGYLSAQMLTQFARQGHSSTYSSLIESNDDDISITENGAESLSINDEFISETSEYQADEFQRLRFQSVQS